jgi:hypothetical protein
MLSGIMLIGIMLSVIMLNVIVFSVITAIGVAHFKQGSLALAGKIDPKGLSRTIIFCAFKIPRIICHLDLLLPFLFFISAFYLIFSC